MHIRLHRDDWTCLRIVKALHNLTEKQRIEKADSGDTGEMKGLRTEVYRHAVQITARVQGIYMYSMVRLGHSMYCQIL